MLSHPVHFFCSAARIWPELLPGGTLPIDGAQLSAWAMGIENNWVIRTHYELRLRGVVTTIGPGLRRGAMNLAAPVELGRRQRDPLAFVVVPRGDAHLPRLADFVIDQNALAPAAPWRASMPHWPQPGLVPRDPARGGMLGTVAFKGRLWNLDPAFRDEAFRARLAALGMTLALDAFDGGYGVQGWHDYSAADVVLAVRDLTVRDAGVKPASKLVNAWFAEVPALLGPEPAFRELRRSELDYIEVRSPDDAISALGRLKETPALYRAMVENGRARRRDFTEDSIAGRWIEMLNGPIAAAFMRWQHQGPAVHVARYAAMCLREPLSKRRHMRELLSGPRLLGG